MHRFQLPLTRCRSLRCQKLMFKRDESLHDESCAESMIVAEQDGRAEITGEASRLLAGLALMVGVRCEIMRCYAAETCRTARMQSRKAAIEWEVYRYPNHIFYPLLSL